MGRVDGKVVLVTGAARGQGEAHARLLASEGAQVLVTDVLDELGEDVAASIGPSAVYQHLDVASEDDWRAAVALVVDRFGSLTSLVNNAAIHDAPVAFESTSLEAYLRTVQVNQVGVFLGMRAVIPHLRDAGGGSIVNISSIGGVHPLPGEAGYASAKWAVRAMTQVGAIEHGKDGIRVNTVLPGMIETPSLSEKTVALLTSGRHPVIQALPLSRVGTPIDVAQLVLFLVSDESSYCTGADFACDGGMLTFGMHNLVPR